MRAHTQTNKHMQSGDVDQCYDIKEREREQKKDCGRRRRRRKRRRRSRR